MGTACRRLTKGVPLDQEAVIARAAGAAEDSVGGEHQASD